MKAKNIVLSLIFIFIIILIFAAADFLIHTLSQEYAVPERYFKNKIIYGTIIGFIAFLFIRKKRILLKTSVFSATVAILLQIRYLLEGYPLDFVLLFLVIHFIILFAVSYVIFKFADKAIQGK